MLFSILFSAYSFTSIIDEATFNENSNLLGTQGLEIQKWVIVKIISTMSIAEIEYNIVKPYVQYWFLTQLFEPFVASVIGSLVGIAGFIAVADLMAYYTRLFKKKK